MSVFAQFLAALDPVARRFGVYTAYRLSAKEYLGAVLFPLELRDARDYLRANDYEPHALAATKRHPETGQLHDLSYRRVPTEHPDAVENSAIADYDPQDCQYHVHCWVTKRGVEFFSHYELRPLKAPFEHYRPRYGSTYHRGVTDLDI